MNKIEIRFSADIGFRRRLILLEDIETLMDCKSGYTEIDCETNEEVIGFWTDTDSDFYKLKDNVKKVKMKYGDKIEYQMY